jgi:class 3 adenylate cyclase
VRLLADLILQSTSLERARSRYGSRRKRDRRHGVRDQAVIMRCDVRLWDALPR